MLCSRWFGSNPKWDVKYHYEDDMDGFNMLKAMIKDSHPHLKEKLKCETMDKPNITNYPTFFQFMKQYRRWVDFEKTSVARREYTDYEHVSNLLKQIDEIDVFDTAKNKIEVMIDRMNHDMSPFPEKLKLKNIGIFIHELLPEDAKRELPCYNAPAQGTINKVNTRRTRFADDKQPPKQNNRNNPNQQNQGPPREWADLICPACGQAGHHIMLHGCDSYAIKENLEKFSMSKKNEAKKKDIMDIFRNHQLNKKNSKKKSGKYHRNVLRRQLRAAKQNNTMNSHEYEQAKQHYIKSFKAEFDDYDLVDPRQDHNLEIREYDVLDSEPESENETNEITEEV